MILQELITQRVMAIAMGFEDANDAARLAGASPQITNPDGSQSPFVIPKGNVFVVTDISTTVPPFLPRSRADWLVCAKHRERLYDRNCVLDAVRGFLATAFDLTAWVLRRNGIDPDE
jgi:hypothetical protein